MILRRALALKKIAEKIPIYIREDELIVGSDGPEPRDVQLFPEFSIFWMEDELNSFDQRSIQAIPFTIDESDKNELLKILDYWKGKTVFDRALSLMLKSNIWNRTFCPKL
jgi:formate C-acetyltransferase